jgi:hypothetical protein
MQTNRNIARCGEQTALPKPIFRILPSRAIKTKNGHAPERAIHESDTGRYSDCLVDETNSLLPTPCPYQKIHLIQILNSCMN